MVHLSGAETISSEHLLFLDRNPYNVFSYLEIWERFELFQKSMHSYIRWMTSVMFFSDVGPIYMIINLISKIVIYAHTQYIISISCLDIQNSSLLYLAKEYTIEWMNTYEKTCFVTHSSWGSHSFMCSTYKVDIIVLSVRCSC